MNANRIVEIGLRSTGCERDSEALHHLSSIVTNHVTTDYPVGDLSTIIFMNVVS